VIQPLRDFTDGIRANHPANAVPEE
jgi:hypothetical protein